MGATIEPRHGPSCIPALGGAPRSAAAVALTPADISACVAVTQWLNRTLPRAGTTVGLSLIHISQGIVR